MQLGKVAQPSGWRGKTAPQGPGFDLGNNLIVAACAGMGITLIQPALIEPELASGQLVIPFQQTADTDRGYYICTRAALNGSHGADQFMLWLLDEANASVYPRRNGVEDAARL